MTTSTPTLSIVDTLKNPALYRKAYVAFAIPLLGALGLALPGGLSKEEIFGALSLAIAAFVGTYAAKNAEVKVLDGEAEVVEPSVPHDEDPEPLR